MCASLCGQILLISPATSARVNCCSSWYAKVDSSLPIESVKHTHNLEEKELLDGIECLMTLEGVRNKARFGRAVDSTVSEVLPETPVEVAALFYISYLYYEKWNHASAVTLINESTAKYNQPEDVADAYKSYRRWFEEIKRIGLAKAREQKLDPLAYTKVKWY